MILKHTSLALILLTLTLRDVYNVKDPSRSLILISEDSPGVLCPVALTKWDYGYYQPWSDNEWLVDEMMVLMDKNITMQ